MNKAVRRVLMTGMPYYSPLVPPCRYHSGQSCLPEMVMDAVIEETLNTHAMIGSVLRTDLRRRVS